MYKKILAAVVTATMIFSLSACVGDNAGTGSTTAAATAAAGGAAAAAGNAAASTAAASGASGDEIKIGFLTPMSGNNATYGAQVKAGGQMIADVINEEHPEMAMALAKEAGLPNLNHAKIKLVFADSKQDPTTAASEAKRLITEEHVVAMTGQYTSAVTKSVAVVTEQYGIPLLTAGSSPSLTDATTGFHWYFRFGANDTYYIRDSFELIKQLNAEKNAGIKTVGLVSEDSEFGANIAKEEERLAKEYGINVVVDITYPSSATNVSSEVMKIKAANPDVVMMSSYAADAILYVKTFKEQNYVPKILLGQRGGFVQPDFLNTMGKDMEYICTTGGWTSDLKSDTSKQLIELYKKYTPDGLDLSEGVVKDMSNVLLLALGINQAGSTDPDKLNDALRNLKVDTKTLPIPWTDITVDQYGQNTSANTFVMQMKDGKYQTVWPSDQAAIDITYPMPAWDAR